MYVVLKKTNYFKFLTTEQFVYKFLRVVARQSYAQSCVAQFLCEYEYSPTNTIIS